MKYKWLCVFFFSGAAFASPLPAPYDSVVEIKPFIDHGWYHNASQLHALIEKYSVKTIVEVGSWLGKSTMDLARCLPEDGRLYAVDTWKGSARHQEGQPSWHPAMPYLYEQFLSNVIHANLTHKIIPIRMDSIEAARSLTVQPDLIYIDAEHTTEAVYSDLRAWYPFVRGRGILCGDDWSWESVRIAVEQFAKENRLTIEASGNFWRLVERKRPKRQ